MTALVLAVGLAAAPEPLLDKALTQLQAFEERAALETLKAATVALRKDPEGLALAYLYTGLAHGGLANRAAAVTAFSSALALNPELALPDWVAPRVVEWFVQAGGHRVERATPVAAPVAPPAPAVVAPVEPPPAPIVTPATGVEAQPPASFWSAGRVMGVVCVGVSLASLGAATGLGVRAQSFDQAAHLAVLAPDAARLRGQAEAFALGSNVAWAAAGALALVALIAFIAAR